jgi:Na+-translocating ferredoxin:NAD+ oxidoreductase RnfG subunit
MKKLIQMSSFMIILAIVTAGLISGMDKLTAKRIEENANFEWKSAILTHNEISHSVTDYVALFDQNFEAIDHVENPRDRVYRNKTTGRITFITPVAVFGVKSMVLSHLKVMEKQLLRFLY